MNRSHRQNESTKHRIAHFDMRAGQVDARHIKEMDFKRTIPIPTLGVGTTDFDIKKEKSEKLYESGRKAAEKFFADWNFAKHVDERRQVKK